MMNVSFDFGDTITQAPAVFKAWAEAVHVAGGTVYMLTGVRHTDGKPDLDEMAPREAWAKTLSFPIEIIYVAHDKADLTAKAMKCIELGIAIHVDNSPWVLREIKKLTHTLPMLVGKHAFAWNL